MPPLPPILYHADIDDATAQQMGKFMVAWGKLEFELDSLFPVLFRINPVQSICITANLNNKAKVEILRSSLSMIKNGISIDLYKEADECLTLASELAGKYRNNLAHGQPFFFQSPDDGWVWARFVARKELSVLTVKETTDFDHWRVATCLVEIVIEGLHNARFLLSKAIRKISKSEWADLCNVPEGNFRYLG